MLSADSLSGIRISLASPEQIKSWSWGEVTKPETINYRSLKPERDGLFCERIFGPTKDFECYCGKYKKIRYKGIRCDRCGVEVTLSKVRRERMGHIDLAAPVAHSWFVKGIPSRIGLLLDLSPRSLERVIYFAQYMIINVDEAARDRMLAELRQERDALADRDDLSVEDRMAAEKEIEDKITDVEDLCPLKLLTDNRYREMRAKYGHMFEADTGAQAILTVLQKLNLDELHAKLHEEINSASGQRRKKAIKRLQVVEAFRRSGNKPEWMILTVLPVLPPDLRPIVQLDGRRFATSDLNDLYRRVINRNNRLRRLLDVGAPEIIIHNEKRMLQEAVDSLIDNGRQRRAITGVGNRPLQSRSDVLRGKQGRFRQNLLGKRVDYSGRSVIVVGPDLELHQCGLPKRMALELFKPFLMYRLVQQGIATNIKSAKRMVERARPEIWGILEEVVKERPVLLNRAPTLHRMSIQAFEPVLIEGSAIQLHPLVCTAFNADFDGDQMAVHVPLSKAAVMEARKAMLSTHNMVLPSNGEPVVAPTLDMVLGCYYLTSLRSGAKGEGCVFGSFVEAELAYNLGTVALGAEIEARHPDTGERLKTTVGRIIFNSVLPKEIGFVNETVDKGMLKKLIAQSLKLSGQEATANMVDKMKNLGFRYATKSGTTISVSDVKVPEEKYKVLKEAEKIVARIEDQHYRGLITDDERYTGIVDVWTETTDKVTELVSQSMDRFGSVYMMATSGAKGNISQIRQMAGMRGLMTDPSGKIIDFPIRSSFNEGLSVLEYFISTHGARKGLADTALRTSDAGYLTRRLVDIVQDMIVLERDCGTTEGIWCTESKDSFLPSLQERIMWRVAAAKVVHPKTHKTIVDQNEEIDEDKAKEIVAAGITQVYVRSPLTCQSRQGVCQACYGMDLSKGRLVDLYTTVGIIAAQSIGEPGTQLTLRTFHTGGVMGLDITTGLPRVEELFEARIPKGQAVLSEIDGIADIIPSDEGYRIKITNTESYRNEYPIPAKSELMVRDGDRVEVGTVLAVKAGEEETKAKGKGKDKDSTAPVPVLLAPVTGTVSIEGKNLVISYEEKEEEEYVVPFTASIRIEKGAHVKAGDQLTEGHVNPQDILRIKGREAAQRYLVDEIQKVYRSQGVNINDKHIEVIARRMLQKVRVDTPGDTELLPGDLVDRFAFEEINARVVAEGGEAATAQTALLGITKAALNADSWLAAASFQETTRVLTEAAINGKIDRLVGLKENVIIGRLIPAQCLTPEELELTKPPQKDLITQIVDAGLAIDSRTEEPAAQIRPDAEIVAEMERAEGAEDASEDDEPEDTEEGADARDAEDQDDEESDAEGDSEAE
ncbi:MAG: DNA-directed RNA polymerase subunit beta' [Dehalococcoidia bacterium]|nr:DNA-directed RNA polymerase subunit beta' [Dehalococcoidia bacterium]